MKLKARIWLIVIMLLLPAVYSQQTADVYIDGVSVSPEDIYAGDRVVVNVTVGNSGSKADNIGIALFVDNRTDAVYEHVIDSLDEGEEKTIELYWYAQEGKHTLYIFADYNGKISESNEDNNIVSIEVDVKKPLYPPFPPEKENATWWDSNWHYRVPVTASMTGIRENFVDANKMAYCNINFTKLMEDIAYEQAGSFSKRTFSPNSVRVIEYVLENNTWKPLRNVGREIILADDYNASTNANVTVMWVMENNLNPHERRYYYIYWDTVENGYKRGEYARIYSGIRNAEFEDKYSSQWKNVTEGSVKWEMGYATDPIEGDGCYKIYAKGVMGKLGYVWLPSYAKVYQNFMVPDEGKTYYILHAKLFVFSDLENVEWQILMDGEAIETGTSTGGWIQINKNITSYLQSKGYVTISFKIEITESVITTEQSEIYAYLDSFWIETPNVDVNVFENKTHGWWADVVGAENEYIAGVEGMDTIERIEVECVASPREVVAKLYSPKAEVVKSSMPLPDPSFEEEEKTYLFASDPQTTAAMIQTGVVHEGKRAIELMLNNYVGKWEFENENVKKGDLAGFRQNITYSISLSELPPLYFWYNIEKSSAYVVLNYTLLTVGSPPRFYTIPLSDLNGDGKWHRYDIPSNIIAKWRRGGGRVVGVEMRLIAQDDEAESTVYIDDLGYSFLPYNATDRTKWRIENFYTFTSGEEIGKWRLDIIIADSSDYRIEKSLLINVDAAANLDVFKIEHPAKVKEGEAVEFVVYITNHGPKDVAEDTPINVSIVIYQENGEYYKMRKSVAGLKVGEEKSVLFSWISSYGEEEYKGKWKIIARVNENGDIPEWNMKDNWYASSIEIEAKPDLKIDMEDVAFLPSNPEVNDTVNISIIVHNNGYENATAKVRIYKKRAGEDRYILITNGSIEKFIERRGWDKVIYLWKVTEEGLYHIKVEVSCEDEKNIANNIVIKDIKVGGGMDFSPPSIESIRVKPNIQAMGESINISASIYDSNTTIDKAIVAIYNESGGEFSYCMARLGESDVYYINVSFNEIGYYTFTIKAWDTAQPQNINESSEYNFRVVYEDIETSPPVIKAISIDPASEKQVIGGEVNISAYIDDESGIKEAFIIVIYEGEEEKHEMKEGGNNIYYFVSKYNKPGKYTYYIKAVDASANANYNVSEKHYFEIPFDYDLDDVPDVIEISLGANPQNASQTINVSVGKEYGYLLWIEKDNKYIYWDRDSNQSRDIKKEDVNGDGKMEILFDVNGDGKSDYYYSPETKEIVKYEVEEEKSDETIWLVPPLVLFALVCVGFLFIRKR
ncbi:MAG TPA: hypothetical protein ENL42_07325 [Thermoplasmatales archaeon]|nr:hypothetical protein [Thermoplasmatales archaeon]